MIPSIKLNKNNLKNNQYQTFDLKLSKAQSTTLEKIKVKKDINLTLNGLYSWDSKISKFLKEAIHEDIDKIKTIIKSLVREMMMITKKDSALIHIRASKKTSYFDVPRWHQDGNYFGNNEALIKMVTTLKGDSTLVRKYTKDTIRHINEYNDKLSKLYKDQSNGLDKKELRLRKELSDKLGPTGEESKSSIVYYVNHQYGAIHSEPKIKQDRLFLAMLPASKKDLKIRRNFINDKVQIQ